MSKASIIGVGTACPDNKVSQSDSLAMFTDIVCENERQKRLAKVLFRKSGVLNRHFVVPYKAAYNWCQPAAAVAASNETGVRGELLEGPETLPEIIPGASAGPTTGERMQMYRKFASGLALQSAEAALEDARLDPQHITHLVTITCTGFDSPGVDIELINRIGLPANTQRVNVGFMGCHAAINGLRTAMAISKSDPNAKVLMTAVELCSLHYRFQWDMEGVIGNALFADGSASLVIADLNGNKTSLAKADPSVDTAMLGSATVDDLNEEGIGESFAPEDLTNLIGSDDAWELAATGSVLIPDSCETMSWTVGDHGFEMLLTNEIGDCIEASLKEWLVDWLEELGLTIDDIDYWGVHPGGPKILSAVQQSLSLTDDDLATSRSILQRYGNMSSPTILFILREFIAAQRASEGSDNGSHCLLLAFGPGLMAEVALLRR